MNDQSITLIDNLKNQLHPNGVVIEIGSDRQGTGSTRYLFNVAKFLKAEFATVDIDPIHLDKSIRQFVMTGEKFIKEEMTVFLRKRQISVAFLDGFDWTDKPVLVRSGKAPSDVYNKIDEYKAKGLEFNNLNAALSGISIAQAILPHMADQSIIYLGDTSWNNSTDSFLGKGIAAAYLIMSQGFNLLAASYKDQGLLFGRNVAFPNQIMTIDFSLLNKKYTGPKTRVDSFIYVNDV